MKKMITALATMLVVAMMAGLWAAPAGAQQEPGQCGTCTYTWERDEYRSQTREPKYVTEYSFKTREPKFVTEYRFQTRTKLYGSKEVKDVKGYDFVSGGTTIVDGQVVAGHWVQSPGWHTIPDVIINIVWGPGGVPDSVLGEGEVNLRVYGGPNVTVKYNAHEVQTDEGYTDWGPWSDWSTINPGPSTATRNVETRQVQDGFGPYSSWSDWSTTDPGPESDTKKVQTREVQDGFTPWSEFTEWGPADPGPSTDTLNVEHRVASKVTESDSPPEGRGWELVDTDCPPCPEDTPTPEITPTPTPEVTPTPTPEVTPAPTPDATPGPTDQPTPRPTKKPPTELPPTDAAGSASTVTTGSAIDPTILLLIIGVAFAAAAMLYRSRPRRS